MNRNGTEVSVQSYATEEKSLNYDAAMGGLVATQETRERMLRQWLWADLFGRGLGDGGRLAWLVDRAARGEDLGDIYSRLAERQDDIGNGAAEALRAAEEHVSGFRRNEALIAPRQKARTIGSAPASSSAASHVVRRRAEAAFCGEVARMLRADGYEVLLEVPIPGGRVDLIANRGDEQLVIEAKLTPTQRNVASALGQLLVYGHHRPGAQLLFACPMGVSDEMRGLLAGHGVEVLNIDRSAP